MRKAIRSWAWVEIVFGGIALFAGQIFAAPWGVIQILIGLLSFFFHSDYSMFIIYAGAFAWAGIMNLTSGTGTWSFMGLLQFYWAYTTYRQFRLYQSAAQALKQGAASAPEQAVSPDAPPPLWARPDEEDSRASRFFPWLALGLSGFGFAVVMMLFISVAANRYIHLFNEVPGWYNFGFEVGLLISIIGVPFGVSSLLSGYSRKAASILAIVVGTLMIAAYLWLRIMGSG